MDRRVLLIAAAMLSLAADKPTDALLQKELDRLRIPEKLTPKGKQPLFMVRAEGVQIYEAKDKDGKPKWNFQAPEATMLDYRSGEKVGTHSKEGQGPVWVDNGASKVRGKPSESNAAPNAAAIPWLLLEAKNENGGRFAKVTYIQRVDTWGGLAPTTDPAKVGEMIRVRYQATYVFWGDAEEQPVICQPPAISENHQQIPDNSSWWQRESRRPGFLQCRPRWSGCLGQW